MTIACSDHIGGLDLTPMLLTLSEDDDLMFKPSIETGHGLAAIQTGQSLIYTPFCKSDDGDAAAAAVYDDNQALGLCLSLGFSCGMESRKHQLNISSTFDNLG